MAENKVNFGLKNVHYAPITVDAQGNEVYQAPIPIPGAVELSLEPRGDISEFYADDILYWVSNNNNQGYDGTLTIANIPEQFAIDCLGEEKGTNGLMTEKATSKGRHFALLFEFDGDVKETKHILYNCSAARPTLGSSTKTNATEPYTNELTFVAMARTGDLAVKTKTTSTTNLGYHNSWYKRIDNNVNTINNNAAATFDLKSQPAAANNTDKTFTILRSGQANIARVTVNGAEIPNGTNGYQLQTNTFTLYKAYMQTLAIGNYTVIIEMTNGNDLAIALTVMQSA